MEGSPSSIVKGGKEKPGDSEAHMFIDAMVESWKNQHLWWLVFSHCSRLSDGNEEKEGGIQRFWNNHGGHWEKQLTREGRSYFIKARTRVYTFNIQKLSWLLSRKLSEKLGRKEAKTKSLKPDSKETSKQLI